MQLGNSMLPHTAFISSSADAPERRSSARRVIRLGFDISETPGSQPLLIIDLSRTGILLRTNADLKVGEKIRVILPESGTVEAEIVRHSGNEFGARFAAPIRNSTVSAVVLASPFETSPQSARDIRPDGAIRPSHETPPVLSWLLYLALTVTALIAGFIVFAIGFLPITGW